MKRRTWQHGWIEARFDDPRDVIRSLAVFVAAPTGVIAEGAGDPSEPPPTTGRWHASPGFGEVAMVCDMVLLWHQRLLGQSRSAQCFAQ
jgi:hypothetical protein